jgi:hypothetical protein
VTTEKILVVVAIAVLAIGGTREVPPAPVAVATEDAAEGHVVGKGVPYGGDHERRDRVRDDHVGRGGRHTDLRRRDLEDRVRMP